MPVNTREGWRVVAWWRGSPARIACRAAQHAAIAIAKTPIEINGQTLNVPNFFFPWVTPQTEISSLSRCLVITAPEIRRKKRNESQIRHALSARGRLRWFSFLPAVCLHLGRGLYVRCGAVLDRCGPIGSDVGRCGRILARWGPMW